MDTESSDTLGNADIDIGGAGSLWEVGTGRGESRIEKRRSAGDTGSIGKIKLTSWISDVRRVGS